MLDGPSTILVGAPVDLTATADDLGEQPVYRFSVATVDGDPLVVRDFSPGNTFTWSPPQEGTYEIQVTAKESVSATTAETSSTTYTALSRLEGPDAVVAPTSHPLVALYSAPPADARRMHVEFRPLGSDQEWESTAPLPIEPGSSTNFLVAGMRPDTTYEMRHVLNDGTTSRPLTFTTGALPTDVTFPTFTQEFASAEATDTDLDTILHMGITNSADAINLLATDRMGDVTWYYDHGSNVIPGYTTTLVPGGTVLLFGDRTGYSFREIDLAGNILLETNVQAVNARLADLGHDPIQGFHHDIRRLPNGHTAVLTHLRKTVDLEGTPTPYVGDGVIVFNRDLEIVWAWDSFEHLDTNDLPTLDDQFRDGTVDWTHSNTIAWSPADGNLVISARSLDWVIKVDYANGTGDGHVVWRLGKDGDFTINSPDPYPWFTHQHDTRYIDDSTLLVFDNGNTRREVDPDANSRGQLYFLDEETLQAEILLNVDLGTYAPFVGSAQRLSNGNFVFADGAAPPFAPEIQTIEVLPDGTRSYVQFMEGLRVQYRSYIYDTLYGELPEPVGSASRSFDVDGDSRADLLVYDPDSATWAITYANEQQETRRFGAPGDVAVPGDYDGDGITDLAVYRPDSDLMSGAAHWFAALSGGGVINQPFGAPGDEPIPADYDGDGITDLAVYRPDSDLMSGAAHWFAALSGGGVIAQPFGTRGDVAVPGDYDGDGLADLAVYRPDSDLMTGTAHWFAALSGGGTISQPLGIPGDVAVPGDYDGDGTTDLAVYRPDSDLMPGAAHWFAALSGGGAMAEPFGAPGDAASPADHDGDGTTDLAVYRAESSEAFLLRSRDQALHLAFEELDLGRRCGLLGTRINWPGTDPDGDA